jgi:hypothetical protein
MTPGVGLKKSSTLSPRAGRNFGKRKSQLALAENFGKEKSPRAKPPIVK